MSLYKERKFFTEQLKAKNISFDNIFEELPVTLHNSALVNGFLFSQSSALSAPTQIYDHQAVTDYLTRLNELLSESVEEHMAEYGKNMSFKNSKDRMAVEPSKLPLLIAKKQILDYCRQAEIFIDENIAKLTQASKILEK